MKNITIIIACLFWSVNVFAHNPLTAKFELEATSPKATLLHVYLSQTGLHQALIQHYAEADFASISPVEYKRLAVLYVKEHVSLSADGTELVIGEGGIKLGSHETDFKFLIDNYPEQVKSLTVDIKAFAENGHHTSVFWWKQAEGKSKLILSEENDYRGVLGLKPAPVMTQSAGFSTPSILILLGGVGIVGMVLLARRKPLEG